MPKRRRPKEEFLDDLRPLKKRLSCKQAIEMIFGEFPTGSYLNTGQLKSELKSIFEIGKINTSSRNQTEFDGNSENAIQRLVRLRILYQPTTANASVNETSLEASSSGLCLNSDFRRGQDEYDLQEASVFVLSKDPGKRYTAREVAEKVKMCVLEGDIVLLSPYKEFHTDSNYIIQINNALRSAYEAKRKILGNFVHPWIIQRKRIDEEKKKTLRGKSKEKVIAKYLYYVSLAMDDESTTNTFQDDGEEYKFIESDSSESEEEVFQVSNTTKRKRRKKRTKKEDESGHRRKTIKQVELIFRILTDSTNKKSPLAAVELYDILKKYETREKTESKPPVRSSTYFSHRLSMLFGGEKVFENPKGGRYRVKRSSIRKEKHKKLSRAKIGWNRTRWEYYAEEVGEESSTPPPPPPPRRSKNKRKKPRRRIELCDDDDDDDVHIDLKSKQDELKILEIKKTKRYFGFSVLSTIHQNISVNNFTSMTQIVEFYNQHDGVFETRTMRKIRDVRKITETIPDIRFIEKMKLLPILFLEDILEEKLCKEEDESLWMSTLVYESFGTNGSVLWSHQNRNDVKSVIQEICSNIMELLSLGIQVFLSKEDFFYHLDMSQSSSSSSVQVKFLLCENFKFVNFGDSHGGQFVLKTRVFFDSILKLVHPKSNFLETDKSENVKDMVDRVLSSFV